MQEICCSENADEKISFARPRYRLWDARVRIALIFSG